MLAPTFRTVTMIDTTTKKGKIVEAAMKLAAEQNWSHVSLRDITETAGLPFAALRENKIGSKTQILSAFIRAVDDEVLNKVPERDPGEQPRDALFEILMARFDAMAPYKEALRSITRDTGIDTSLFGSLLNSQRWMLLAAGLDGDGPRGVMRATGLATLFTSVFRIWLDDDDPGQARTMAALDRRLRRAGDTMRTIDQACDGLSRIRDTLMSGLSGARGRFRQAAPGMGPSAATPEDEFGGMPPANGQNGTQG
jgi:ubiquinone biosynthesis protein COQ9